MKQVILFFLLMITSRAQKDSSIAINSLAIRIGLEVLDCQSKLNLDNRISTDLVNFWNEPLVLKSPDFGCALACAFQQIDLLSERGEINYVTATNFTHQISSNSDVRFKLMELFLTCMKAKKASGLCPATLEVTKCFRAGIIALNWAPKTKLSVWLAALKQKRMMPKRRKIEATAESRGATFIRHLINIVKGLVPRSNKNTG